MTRVLVTGTSSGIGYFTAEYLLSQQVEVVGVSRREVPTLSSHAKYTHVTGDVTDAATIKAIVAAVGPSLDGAVFNAGILEGVANIADIDIGAFRHVFEVNVFSVVELTKELIPALRHAHGRAIYVGSGAASGGYVGWAAYGASKAALHSFAATLAREEPDIVSVAVAPGVVDTSMQDLIRDTHVPTGAMGKDAQKFLDLKKDNKLVDPRDSGKLYGNLAIAAKKDLSGGYFRYNDERLQ